MPEKLDIFKPCELSPNAFAHDHDAADFRHVSAVIFRRLASLTRPVSRPVALPVAVEDAPDADR